MSQPTATLTFGNQVENHTGMEITGMEVEKGFTVGELVKIQRELGGELHRLELDGGVAFEQAAVLVIRSGVNLLADADKIFEELLSLKWDRQYYDVRRGEVLNKNARANLNFAHFKQEADFEKGKGTIINFDTVPAISNLRDKIQELLVNKHHRTPFPVLAEGNLYENTHSSKKKDERGIGWHGDTERRNVIGARFGATMCIKFAWFQWSRQISDAYEIVLNHGDIYIMSEKAVGCDWKRTKGGHLSLRHCAGIGKYVEDKERGEYSEKRPEKKEKEEKK